MYAWWYKSRAHNAEFRVLQQNTMTKNKEMEEESMCYLKQMKENLVTFCILYRYQHQQTR